MLKPDESDLVGRWIESDHQIRRDPVCERIEWLIANHLEEVAVSDQWGAWETLYRDPNDGRFWERTYPQGEMQGGGPPRLTVLGEERARQKYKIKRTK
jgi:Immunity protein 27